MDVDDRVAKATADGIRKRLTKLLVAVSEKLERMAVAETVEEIMEIKREILRDWLLILPLTEYECYFCQLTGEALEEKYHCERCEYGMKHGVCLVVGSDFHRMMQSIYAARIAVAELYYKTGETYTLSPTTPEEVAEWERPDMGRGKRA